MTRERYSLYLDSDVRECLKEEARRTKRRMSEVVNERLRASFQDARAALEDIRRARDNGTLDLDQIAGIGDRFGPDIRAQALAVAIGGMTETEYAGHRKRDSRKKRLAVYEGGEF